MSDRLKLIREGKLDPENGKDGGSTGTGRPPMGPGSGRGGPGGPGGHGPAGMMPGEKAKDFKGSLRKLMTFLKPFWFQIVVTLLLRRGRHRVHH